MLLHILDDDDGIIHHKTDGKHHGEKRQRINGKAQNRKGRQCPDQGDRHCEKRDYRGPPVLQEEEYDQHDQQECLDKGLDNLIDGCRDKVRIIHDDPIFQVGGEIFRTLLQNFLDFLEGVHRIRIFCQHDAKGNGILAVVFRKNAGILGAGLDTGNIPKTDKGTVGHGFQYDVLEFLRHGKTTFHDAGVLLLLVLRCRELPDRSRRSLDILSLDGRNHITGCKPHIGQLVRIQPDTHGVVRAKHLDITDTMDALDVVLKIDLQVIVDECTVISPVR